MEQMDFVFIYIHATIMTYKTNPNTFLPNT